MTYRVYVWGIMACAGLALSAVGASRNDLDLADTAGAMHVWHMADGLPSDSVTAIIQTRDGFLWVGTSAGLVRFDGVSFTEVPLADFSTNQRVHVTALCEDSHDHLWIGTRRDGLFRLAQNQMQHFTAKEGLLDDNVASLAADDRGQVWIGGDGGLNLWTGEKFESYIRGDGLSDRSVSGVNVARSGTVWITTRTGMCRFIGGHIVPYAFKTESQGRSPEYLGAYEDRRGNLWAFGDTYLINLAEGKRFNYFRGTESASVRIWSLCEGRDGRLWIGTSGRGLFCFEDNRFQPVMLGENRWPYDVRAIYEDREGNLWLGTSGGGLAQLRPQSVHVLRAGHGLPAGPPTAIAPGPDGQIYVGMQRGGLFAGQSGRFDRVGGSDGLAVQNFVSSVCIGRDGTVWAGTMGDGLYGLRNGRGVHLTTADGLADNAVLAVCVDESGALWASTGAGTLHRFADGQSTLYGPAQGLPGVPLVAMIPANGGLWLGTQDGRVLREQDGRFRGVRDAANKEHRPVLALHQGKQGRLWIGTAGSGLICLANGSKMSWSTRNGLPNNIVAGVVEDNANNLWLATGSGIYRINRDELRKALGDPTVPLVCELMSEVKTSPEPGMIPGGSRAALAANGELWFATEDGVLNVDTHHSEVAPSAFPVYLESASFNSQPPALLLRGGLWSPASANRSVFKAPVDVRSFEVDFTALSFASPKDIRFRHKLEGFDADWVDDGQARSARYGRLPYGQYRFRAAARNGDGRWQEATETFSFVVPTPIYFQFWAICLYVMAAVALVAGTVRMVSHRRLRVALARLEQQQALERERMRIARDMHDEMGSKLTKISFLSEHAQVDAAPAGPLAGKIQVIAQTSRELLQTMDEIVWVVNPHNDTLENLVAYLSHYADEYFQNTRIDCSMRLPPEIPQCQLSSEVRHNLFLAFEETLNNVLKHSEAEKVNIEMGIRPPAFEIRITDNGKGFVPPAEKAANGPRGNGRDGNGLRNMRQRLADVGGECRVSSHPGGGTTVTLHIPLKTQPSVA